MVLSVAALTTVATVLDELDLEDDFDKVRARVERYIESASSLVAIILGNGKPRQLHEGEVVEAVRGMDHPTLILRAATPIVSVTSVSIRGGVVDAADYEVADADCGFVDRVYGTWPSEMQLQSGVVTAGVLGTERKNITVTYVGGWRTPGQGGTRTLPHAIEQAVITLVKASWHSRSVDPRLASMSNTGSTYTYDGEPVPATVMAALAPFIRVANA